VVNSLCTRHEQIALVPLYDRVPPHALVMTSSGSAVDEQVPSDIVSVFNDCVLSSRAFLFRDSEKPSSTVSKGAVLLPSAEVIPSCYAFPACAPNREVVLSSKKDFIRWSVAVSQIGLLETSEVKPQTFL